MAGRQSGRQAEWQAGKVTGRLSGRQAEWQAEWQAGRQSGRQAGRVVDNYPATHKLMSPARQRHTGALHVVPPDTNDSTKLPLANTSKAKMYWLEKA